MGRPFQALGGAALALACVLALQAAGALERMELGAYDAGLRARRAAPVDGRVVLIDETEDDLSRFGHPLSDATLADIIERVLALGPRVVGIDKYRDIPVAPGTAALERVLAERANVVWAYQFGGHGMRRIPPPRALADQARTGFVDIVLDPSGVVRRGLLYLDDGGTPQPSFSLRLAAAYLSADGIAPRSDGGESALLRLGAATIAPLEAHDGGYAGADAAGYQFLLDYRGAPERFARVTLADLMDGKADPGLVRGRIAILGSSAHSLKDFFHTPFSEGPAPYITGAELHAHQASQLLRLAYGESAPVRTLPDAAELALIALCCVLGLAAWLVSRAISLAALLAAGLGALAAAWLAGAAYGVWLPAVSLGLAFLLSAAVAAALRSLYEARERGELMTLFSRHVAPEFARELWQRRGELADGGALRPRRLEATVLFADLHGYSPVAERLPAEETALWLNQFMQPMAETIMAHRGVIRQFAGDAVMAVFGAPIPSETREQRERDARAAVACAREMCRRFEELDERWRAAGRPTAGLRIGIHSGAVVGCNIGTRQRMEYAVVGDAVNLAARLQSLELPQADQDRCRILTSPDTRALLETPDGCLAVGSMPLKGRREPVDVYRVPA
jgi:adenylate cyclase